MTPVPNIADIKNSYKGILLDFDNTLYDYAPCHEYALLTCHEFFNFNIEAISFEKFLNLYTKGRAAVKKNNVGTSGSRSRHLYFQLMLEIMYKKTDTKNSLVLGDVYWKAFVEKMSVRPWMPQFLKDARAWGLKVVLITNQESSLQYKKLQRLGLENDIDFMVTSEEAGVEKPDLKIFSLALAKISMKPDDVVMIGDDPKEDGVGAKAAGISFLLCGS